MTITQILTHTHKWNGPHTHEMCSVCGPHHICNCVNVCMVVCGCRIIAKKNPTGYKLYYTMSLPHGGVMGLTYFWFSSLAIPRSIIIIIINKQNAKRW